MKRRQAQAAEFYSAALDPEETPWFVSDMATLYDIYSGDEDTLVQRCRDHYGVELKRDQFAIPIWELLDFLGQNRTH